MGWDLLLAMLDGLGRLAYAVVAVFTGFYILTRFGMPGPRAWAETTITQARLDAENIRREADLTSKEEQLQLRQALERELDALRAELRDRERRLNARGEGLEQLQESLIRRELELETGQKRLAARTEQAERERIALERDGIELRSALLGAADLSPEQARAEVLARIDADLAAESNRRAGLLERRHAEAAERRARELILIASQRLAAPVTAEATVATVEIPDDQLRGRIIGREGRNIRAFEKAAGVDVSLDDSPGVLIISCFDPMRREVAQRAMRRLLQDGRIHPARIEDVIVQARRDLDIEAARAGRDAVEELGLLGLQINDQLLDALGRLRHRTSYAQNVLRHSVEVAWLAGMMAEELGLQASLARRCGLLHDVGKATAPEAGAAHTRAGAELCRRCGEPPEVVEAALCHHDQLDVDRPYTALVATADAISASRPGARRDSLERHLRRQEDLELIASAFPGVEQAYAVQAGREVRVLVDGRSLDDSGAADLCRQIARAIREKSAPTGEVKVVVIRETRAVEWVR